MTSYRPFLRAVPVWGRGLASRKNTWLSFHANLTLPRAASALIRIAAAQAYRIWVNGALVGRGPARTAHGHARVDEWTAAIGDGGRFEIRIEVMGYGVPTFCSTGEPPFCCAEVVVGKRAVAWTGLKAGGFSAELRKERVQKVERYSYQRAFIEAYRIGAAGATWAAAGYLPRKALPLERVTHPRKWLERGVAYPDLSVVTPLAKAVRGTTKKFNQALAKTAPKWGHLYEIPEKSAGYPMAEVEWRLHETLIGTEFRSTGPAKLGPEITTRLKTGAWVRADFGADRTGFPAVNVRARTATRLLLVFDEILVDDHVKFNRSGCENSLWIELVAGAQLDFEAMEPYTFRFLQVLVWSGDAEVGNIRMRHYINGTKLSEGAANLTPQAALVRRAALSSYRQNALDLFMDCPARERAGWLCDSLFTARAEWHLTGDNVIERAFLENYLVAPQLADLPKGMVPMCYPAEALQKQFIPNWAMFYIIQLDEAQRLRRLPKAWKANVERSVRGLLRYFRPFENEVGLLEKLESWVFVEWSKANNFVQDVNFPTNMLYAMTLRSAARLLGDARLEAQAQRIETTIRTMAWRDGRFVDNAVRDKEGRLAVTEHASEVCQYYAFFTGVASTRRETALWRRLVREEYGPMYPANVFVGKIMRFQLLLENGEFAAARREVLKNYVPMARTTGTLWELFEKNVSCNHGFTSYIAVLIDRLAEG